MARNVIRVCRYCGRRFVSPGTTGCCCGRRACLRARNEERNAARRESRHMAADAACADGVGTEESRWCAEWACGDGMPIVRRMRARRQTHKDQRKERE